MRNSLKGNSMRSRLILIYFLLVFIAMTIVGVFVMQQLESYHMGEIRRNLTKTLDGGMLKSLNEYDDLKNYQTEVQTSIDNWRKGIQEEVFVIDKKFNIIASSNPSTINKSAMELLDENLIIKGLQGEVVEKDDVIGAQKIPVKNMVFPISHEGESTGSLYVRSDLSNIYGILNKSKSIFVQAMVIALFVTVVLGMFISRTITVPINEVTEKAEKMSQGDFSQKVNIKSDDEIGRLAGMFNLLRDKLDYTLSEISNEKSKLEIILKNMADGLIAVDLEGNVIHANKAAFEMLKITKEEVENNHFDDIIARYCPALTLLNIKAKEDNLEGHEIFEFQGSMFDTRYAVFRAENNNDNSGLVMIIQDITEREKLDKMQRDFVANVSHELKTPLTTIKSYTETLLDSGILEGMPKQFLEVIEDEADRMSRLVKDLLQLSRLDYQRETWNKEPINITRLIQNIVSKIEINAINKKQHLNCLFYDKANVIVYIDKDKIEQVLQNILSNAIKYTAEQGRIDVDVVEGEQEVAIFIRDNGIGIPEQELPRLFERFYRTDKARSRALGGTGLGLSIAKQIIEGHGGSIKIESKESKGTNVIITIPLHDEKQEENII